jgi:hypothetical protein
MTLPGRPDASAVHRSSVPALRLRLTHNAGEARSGALRIPSTGAGLAEALELCGERQSDAQWRLANLCRIAWHAEAGRWQLLNGSRTLTCVHNGARVAQGGSVPIAEGDWLELGLLRFVVEGAEGGNGGESETSERSAAGTEREAPSEQALPAFDLRDLAGLGEADAGPPGRGDPLDAFGIGGAPFRSTHDVLAALMGASSPNATHPVAAVSAPTWPPPRDGAPLNLFDELHDEFVRVVRDAGQLAGRTDWEGLGAASDEPAPSLDDLQQEAAPYALLRDILLPPEGIDRILEHFEPLAYSDLLDAAEPADVLGLFAPELARDAKVPLPGLTRREHHALSPDSHLHIGSVQAAARDDEEGASR